MVAPVTKLKPIPSPPAHKEALMHILHVDDEVGLLETTKQILEMIGPFQVKTVSSVEEALKKLDKYEKELFKL